MKSGKLQIAGLCAVPGKRASGWLPIVNGPEAIPLTLLCGAQDGPTVLITAGIHSAEYVGIQAAIELSKELDPAELHGDIILAPLVCRDGFEHRTMSVMHADGKNLNRIFPGSPTGTPGERVAWTVTELLHKRADAYIDLHGGDGFEELTSFIFCAGATAPRVADESRRMAEQADVPYLVVSPIAGGGSYNHAASNGVPSVLLERGVMGSWNRDEVEADKKDVRNILRVLRVLDSAPEPRKHKPVSVGRVIYARAGCTGCWYPCRRPANRVQKGELLGEIRDYNGALLEAYHAEQDGIILYQTASLNILERDVMIAYSGLPETAGI